MKRNQKWTALLLTVLMLINCMCINAFAAGEKSVLLDAPESAQSGTNVRVSVQTDFYGTADGKLVFTYDAEKLSFVALETASAWASEDAVVFSVNQRDGKIILAFASKETAGIGEIFTLTFKAQAEGKADVALDGKASYITGVSEIADQTATINVETSTVVEGQYRVVFDQGRRGVFAADAETQRDIPVGETIGQVPAVTPDFGYVLSGWMIDAVVYSSEEIAAMKFENGKTVTIVAQYEIDAPAGQIPVYFYADGNGTLSGSEVVYVSANGQLTAEQLPETQAKTGYAFAYWYCITNDKTYFTNELCAEFITEPMRLMAVFTPVMAPTEPDEPTEPSNPTKPSTEVTTNPDGSVTTTTTNPDGSVDVTVKAADGSAVTVAYDAAGAVTEIVAEIPASAEGKTVTLPLADNAAMTTPVDVSIPATVDSVTIVVPVSNGTSGMVVVIVNEDGTEKICPKSYLTDDGVAVELNSDATIKVMNNTKTFADTGNHWARNAITFVSARELFNGVGNNTFAPGDTMTRAMLATVLWRMEGKVAAAGKSTFTDVAAGMWYSDAIAWASAAGIINGYGDTFGVNDAVTREQMITILYRLSGSPAVSTSVEGASPWAANAMAWAVETGLIQGGSNGLNAQGTATRAEVATILMRFIEQ